MTHLRAAIVIIFAFITSACVAGEHKDTPEEFWEVFQQSVAEDDIEKLASLTHFPFKTRGVHDSMPVETYDKEAFLETFPLILQTKVPRQQQEGSISLREFILEKESLTASDFSSDDQLWIGDFKFDDTEDGWGLSFIYWSEDQLDQGL